MKYTSEMKMVKEVANNISNPMYEDNIQATVELMELFDDLKEQKLDRFIAVNPLKTYKDYVKMYDENFYTYSNFEELVKSEEEQSDGLTREECREQINNTIWQLSCGWYVQYV